MNENIQKVLKDRYFLKKETSWGEVAKRISKIYPDIYEDILECRFIPGSPTIMNANTKGERFGTLSSCFPMGIDDSTNGIFDAVKEAAIVTKMGGGIGYDYTILRSSMEMVKSLNRKSSGPLPFINIFNSVLDGIQQGGSRRGAGMAMLSIKHPQSPDFIVAKNEEGPFDRFNFAVRISNLFYKQLEKDPDGVHSVIDSEGRSFSLTNADSRPITVQQIWDSVIEQAWKNGEPGIFNEDIAYERCTVTNVNKHVLCNPCLLATAWLLTTKGLRQLKDICVGDMIWSKEGWTKVVKKWDNGIKEVYEWGTTAGSISLTEKHEVMSRDKKVEIGEALEIDTLIGDYTPRSNIISKLVMDGIVLGDGSVHKASNDLVYLCVGRDDTDYFTSEISHLFIKDRRKAFKYGWEIQTTITPTELPKTYERIIPERYFKLNKDELFSFLRGVFSANGSICGGRASYKSTSFQFIQQLQILLSSLGIRSYYTINKAKKVKFHNGTYQCKESYDLNITTDRHKFQESIGFVQKYKCAELQKHIENKKRTKKAKVSYDINNKTSLGKRNVYDIEVDNSSHTFWCDGFNISNCAEFVNIPYTACALGSINVSKLLTPQGTFDWERYEQHVVRSIRYINNTLDVNTFPLKKIKDTTLSVRPLGLGIMGLAHLMFRLKIPFNSKEAIKLTEDIVRYETLRAMQESVILAKEYGASQVKEDDSIGRHGAYPEFDYDLFMSANKRFFTRKKCQNIDVEELQKQIKQFGVRNSCFTSIAPTGTISFIADCSSGIEPVFALAYTRSIEVANHEYEDVAVADPVFSDYLDENFDEKIKERILKQVVENKGSCQKCNDIPEEMRKVFITAGELTADEHLDSLEVVANNVSLSVSKTINLPRNTTKEEMHHIYIEAYKRGIIGVTVYRDGSRDKTILTHKENGDKIVEKAAPERPKSLFCHVYKIATKDGDWAVFVGLLQGHPFEVFAGKIDLVALPSTIKEGNILRSKSGIYQFEHEGEVLIRDISKLFESGAQSALTRVISLALKSGAPIEALNKQLGKSVGNIVDFNKAILRALKRYMKEKESGNKCPCCGVTLIYKEGCETCVQCGWSKCG